MEVFYKSTPGSSGINGDSIFLSDNSDVFALSDGASGSFDKVEASALAIKYYKENKYSREINPKKYLKQSILKANDLLLEKSRKDGSLSFATLISGVIQGNNLYISGVGDSIAYIIRNDKIISIYNPLKKYENAIFHNVISRKDAETAVYNLPDVLRSSFDYFIPDVIPTYSIEEISLVIGDIIFICSDGINDWIEHEFLVNKFKFNTVEIACNMIFDYVSKNCNKDRNDDKSIICFRI